MIIYNQNKYLVVKTQKGVIALLNEIKELKVNFINNEAANWFISELKAV